MEVEFPAIAGMDGALFQQRAAPCTCLHSFPVNSKHWRRNAIRKNNQVIQIYPGSLLERNSPAFSSLVWPSRSEYLGGGVGYKGASDLYIDANTQLAISAGREIHKLAKKKTVVLLPDGPELARSSKLFKSALDMSTGVSMSHLYEGREPLKKGLQSLFGMNNTDAVPAAAAEADVHIVINTSTNELVDVQKYFKEVRDSKSIKRGGNWRILFLHLSVHSMHG
jgi:hypothetical protein